MTPRFIEALPRHVFFTGKGGVGKTSLSCAVAVRLADAGKRVLLVSTDPASNIGQVFGVDIGNRITGIPAVSRLSALEIDPEAAAGEYRRRVIDPLRGTTSTAELRAAEEQLSGACTTEIAAFDAFTSLLTDAEMVARFDHIVFDTAPTGHTIRLLQLPGAWSGFLDSGLGDASCLGPLAGLERQREQYHAAVDALADAARTRLVLVSRAHPSALREVARTQQELAAIGFAEPYLVINGVFPDDGIDDPLAGAVRTREQAALDAMSTVLAALPCDRLPLLPFDLVGVEALRRLFGDPISSTDDLPAADPLSEGIDNLATLIDAIAADGHGLVMVMGKGGVGKTTVAAAIALALAKRGQQVHLTTTDPAAHLADALQGTTEGLQLSRIDPVVETARYREETLRQRGAGLDAQARALIEEDLRSPCTEEIAVFQAFSRRVREGGRHFVVMDTAPTGHTLLLIDSTGAYHRQMARSIGKTMPFVTPLMQLQDPRRTKVIIVTLAETTPVLEAAALQDDLRRAGIEPWAWVINQSVAAASTRHPLLRRRAAAERSQIEAVRGLSQRVALLPLLAIEPTGPERLLALATGVDGSLPESTTP